MPSAPPSLVRSVSMTADPAYWQALGKFIETFAGIEILLFNYLAALSGMRNDIARIFYGEDQAHSLITLIRQVMALRSPGMELKGKTELALDQLQKISVIRNRLVHYVSFVTSDKGRIISNIARVKNGKAIIEYRASTSALGEMTADLETISHLLVYCLLGLTRRTAAERAEMAADLPRINNQWQYTQP